MAQPDTDLDTVTAIATAVRAGDLTARAATEAALARIADRDSAIGAFQVVRSEAALREADAVDQRADRFSLPLAGVPIAIKDNIAVSGEPMRNGSAATDMTPREFDHELVRRLRRAGAVVVGLTRVPELCVFGATDSVFGTTRNPWNPDRTPGGSSGGAAAAVGAGMIAAAHGNDGMGSIRIPAACCGLVGIKAGHGLVPAQLGNGSWFDMAENGPLATTVADCALLLSVMAGRPELSDVSEPAALRIAVSSRSPIAGVPVDRSWAEAAPAAAGVFREAGHTVRQANPPYGQLLGPSSLARWMAGIELDARLVSDRSRLARRTKAHAAAGRLVLRAGFPKEAGRERWRRRAESFFAVHDVLVTPVLAQSPIRSAAWVERGWLPNLVANVRYAPFAAPWNVAGWPALAVPTGVGPDGMPRVVQLVGRPGSEATLLGLAAQLERRRPWQRVAPAYAR